MAKKAKYTPQELELQYICKLIEESAGKYNRHDIFHDILELMACTISMTSDSYRKEERVATYRKLIEKHGEDKPDSTHYMGRIQYAIMDTLYKARKDKNIIDVLGPIYSAMGMNGSLGQFFTPFCVSHAMARMTFGELDDLKSNKKQYEFLNEPTCGAGGMILAAAQIYNEEGVDYRRQMAVQASDIDNICCMMAYIQCSLYQIPVVIICMDALKDPNGDNARDIWTTPAFFQFGWPKRLNEVA